MIALTNDLPRGWVRTTVGELVQFEYGKGLVRGNRETSGKYEVFGSNGSVGKHSVALVSEPCLVVGRKGAIGRVHLSQLPCWPIDTTYYVIPSHLDLRFLFYLLQWLDLGTLDRSTAIPGLNRDDAYAVSVGLPPSPEQRRIASKMEELFTKLDAGVGELRKAQTQLKRYRQAVLKAAVTGELTREWREANQAELEPASELVARVLQERRERWEADQLAKLKAGGKPPRNDEWKKRYRPPSKPPVDELPEVPETWTWATIDQTASFESNALTDGPFGSNLMTKHYTSAGPRVIRLQNIGDGIFIDEKAFISQQHFDSLSKHQVYAGEIVIASLSEVSPRSCIIPPSVGAAIVKADCIRFKPNRSLASSEYLNYALNSEPTRRRTMDAIHGVGRPRLGLGGIRQIALPLPPQIEQQQIRAEVERCFSVAEAIERAIDQGLKQAERMRQSILKKAFEGKLVPQDPNDEPAEPLVERIKIERAKREAEKSAASKPNRVRFRKKPNKRIQGAAA